MHLKLKEKPFLNFASASDHELEAFFSILEGLDANITRNDRSKECLSGRPSLRELLKHCCYQRKYVFGIKKNVGNKSIAFANHLTYPKMFLRRFITYLTQRQRMNLITNLSQTSMAHSPLKTLAFIEEKWKVSTQYTI